MIILMGIRIYLFWNGEYCPRQWNIFSEDSKFAWFFLASLGASPPQYIPLPTWWHMTWCQSSRRHDTFLNSPTTLLSRHSSSDSRSRILNIWLHQIFFHEIYREISQKKHTKYHAFLLVNNEIMGERPNLKVQLEKISIIYFLEDFTVPF